MRGSRKFCQRGSKFDNFFYCIFLADRGIEDPNTALIGPSLARQRNACECWLGTFVIFQGIQTSIAKKPYIFVFFQGGGGSRPPAPPLWIRPCYF